MSDSIYGSTRKNWRGDPESHENHLPKRRSGDPRWCCGCLRRFVLSGPGFRSRCQETRMRTRRSLGVRRSRLGAFKLSKPLERLRNIPHLISPPAQPSCLAGRNALGNAHSIDRPVAEKGARRKPYCGRTPAVTAFKRPRNERRHPKRCSDTPTALTCVFTDSLNYRPAPPARSPETWQMTEPEAAFTVVAT